MLFVCSLLQQRRTDTAIPATVFVWGFAGALLAAECVHVSIKCLSRYQRCTHRSVKEIKKDAKENEENALLYWSQLSNAILSAPRNDTTKDESFYVFGTSPLDAPLAVRLVWDGDVQYTISTREVLQLLGCTPQTQYEPCRKSKNTNSCTTGAATSAASLALLWRLQLLRTVKASLFIHNDTVRCEDDLAELETHSSNLFHAFIHPHSGTNEGHAMAMCWEQLSTALPLLHRRRWSLCRRDVLSLARYVYAGGSGRLASAILTAAATTIATHSATVGLAVRGHVELLLRGGNCEGSLNPSSTTSQQETSAKMRLMAGLLAYELARLITTSAVASLTSDGIRATASHHREKIKCQLYTALAYTPLSYFDTHDADEVEEIVYYPNDLEGVDVHVHDYVTRGLCAAVALAAALHPLTPHSRAVVLGAVVTAAVIRGAIGRLRRRCLLTHGSSGAVGCDGDADMDDAEEAENGVMAQDGAMLRGLDIISSIHELRPYAADVTLMSWWTHEQQRRRRRWKSDLSSGRRCFWTAMGRRRLWALDAVASLTEWLAPALVTAHAAATCQTPCALVEAVRAAKETLTVIADTGRVVEVVMHNAHKAGVLGRLLDKRNWEGQGRDDQCDNENDNEGNSEKKKRKEERKQKEGDLMTNPKMELTTHGVESASAFTLCRIRASRLQFQYPAAPTINAFPTPATFEVQLQDAATGTGRFICITGASGCGKTTLLRLLLGLYTTTSGLDLQLRQRDASGSEYVKWEPIASVPRRLLRTQFFSYVPQVPTLFNSATIAQNVSLRSRVSVMDTALLQRVGYCTSAASCEDFVSRLPQGPLTPLSETVGWGTTGAVRLSCGQGQRLMLARAIFHGGEILLMDEPTAGLDAETKRNVLEKWRALLQKRVLKGALCVTHDSDVLKEADEIIRL